MELEKKSINNDKHPPHSSIHTNLPGYLHFMSVMKLHFGVMLPFWRAQNRGGKCTVTSWLKAAFTYVVKLLFQASYWAAAVNSEKVTPLNNVVKIAPTGRPGQQWTLVSAHCYYQLFEITFHCFHAQLFCKPQDFYMKPPAQSIICMPSASTSSIEKWWTSPHRTQKFVAVLKPSLSREKRHRPAQQVTS